MRHISRGRRGIGQVSRTAKRLRHRVISAASKKMFGERRLTHPIAAHPGFHSLSETRQVRALELRLSSRPLCRRQRCYGAVGECEDRIALTSAC